MLQFTTGKTTVTIQNGLTTNIGTDTNCRWVAETEHENIFKVLETGRIFSILKKAEVVGIYNHYWDENFDSDLIRTMYRKF